MLSSSVFVHFAPLSSLITAVDSPTSDVIIPALALISASSVPWATLHFPGIIYVATLLVHGACSRSPDHALWKQIIVWLPSLAIFNFNCCQVSMNQRARNDFRSLHFASVVTALFPFLFHRRLNRQYGLFLFRSCVRTTSPSSAAADISNLPFFGRRCQ